MKHCFKILSVTLVFISTFISGSVYAQTVSAGENHSIAICKSGGIMAWGLNTDGEVGDSTRTDRLLPAGNNKLTNVVAVVAGQDHSAALKNDGTVWRWGNGAGNVGISPKQISGFSGVKAISSSGAHILTLKNDSTVWAWGANDLGQLGDSTTNYTITPVKVKGISGIIAIAGGYRHSLALKNDGTVWGWGYNNYGGVGDGTTWDQHRAVPVSGLTNVKAIAAGFDYSMAIKNDGTVWAWGYNGQGQLGDSTKTYRVLPKQVKMLNNIKFIACGYQCAFAIKDDGTVWSWGSNGWGQMGSNGAGQLLVPEIISKLAGIKYISSSWTHTIMVNKHDSVFTCGGNDCGQLGIGNKVNQNLKVAVRFLCPLLSNIKVTGKNMEISNGDRTPVIADNTDFGSVKVSDSKVNVFRLYNMGSDTLVVNMIRVSGSDSANFTVQNLSFPLKIKKGDSLSFTITFTPLSKGIKTTNLTITYNDEPNNLYSFTVKGVATFPAIVVRGLNKEIINGDMSPSSTDNTSFGSVKRYMVKKNRFTIKNTGTDTLKISKVITTGADSILFTAGNINLVKTLLPSDSAEFEISFQPLDSGAKTGTVNIYSNDPGKPVYQYAVDGTGISPVMKISGNHRHIGNNDMVPDTADHTDFGTTVKPTDVKWDFTVYNSGNDTLFTKNIQVGGPNSTRFIPDISQLKPALLPGDSTFFGLTLKADSLGLKKAVIRIYSNDTDRQPYSFSVQGTVMANSGLHGVFEDVVRLYPNPADNMMMVDFGTVVSKASILIYSGTGQLVFEYDETNSSGIQVNTGNMPPGLYMVHVRMDGKVAGKMLLIAR